MERIERNVHVGIHRHFRGENFGRATNRYYPYTISVKGTWPYNMQHQQWCLENIPTKKWIWRVEYMFGRDHNFKFSFKEQADLILFKLHL